MEFMLYILSVSLLAISCIKDKKKTKKVLLKAWMSFERILPQLLGIVFMVGILLAIFDVELTSKLIGSQSGFMGVLISAVVGAVTLIPGFVAFPTASLLLENGAGYMQVAAFISTLMMVGVATAPLETKYFGKKLTLLRNSMAFIFSFLVAFVIGKVVGK